MISVIFMGLVAYGQTQDTFLTQGTLNGVFWMVMSQGEELMFVLGIRYSTEMMANGPSVPL
jgi:hypothetical protein